MPVHDSAGNTATRARATDAASVATEYTQGRWIDAAGNATVIFTRATLPTITSFTITPDHIRDTTSPRGNLVMSFAVTGSVRNMITQHLADGSAGTNVPLSPATGATVAAPAQSAHYTLLCRNSLGEETHRNVFFTYWTAPTLTVSEAVYLPSPITNTAQILFTLTRGGDPLPTVNVVASDGVGTRNNIITSGTTHRYAVTGARTGTARRVTYTFTASSSIGSETRSITAITRTFNWPQ